MLNINARRYFIGILYLLALCYAKIIVKRSGPPNLPADVKPSVPTGPVLKNISQYIDHFNPTDFRTFQMRYYENEKFFAPGGPIFVFLGGEWAISSGYVVTGQMFDMAKNHSGSMYYVEHRYYGQSIPFSDLSTESLKYLSSKQALEDFMYFITFLKASKPAMQGSKVVVVGASYSANLALWARMKYPHIVDIAYASSAPLHAIEDFYQYHEVVGVTIGLTSYQCLYTIKEGIKQMQQALKSTATKMVLEDLLDTCSPIQLRDPHKQFLFNSIAEIFAGKVQYAKVGQIATECELLNSYEGTAMEKLAYYINKQYNGACLGDYDEFISYYGDESIIPNAYRSWLYQTFTEFGFYQTSNSLKQPYGKTFNLSLNYHMAEDMFGSQFTRNLTRSAINRSNIGYGSTFTNISQSISVHGTGDPWYVLGNLRSKSPDSVAIVVQGTSHCADLLSISANDIPEMKEAKLTVRALVAKWLSY